VSCSQLSSNPTANYCTFHTSPAAHPNTQCIHQFITTLGTFMLKHVNSLDKNCRAYPPPPHKQKIRTCVGTHTTHSAFKFCHRSSWHFCIESCAVSPPTASGKHRMQALAWACDITMLQGVLSVCNTRPYPLPEVNCGKKGERDEHNKPRNISVVKCGGLPSMQGLLSGLLSTLAKTGPQPLTISSQQVEAGEVEDGMVDCLINKGQCRRDCSLPKNGCHTCCKFRKDSSVKVVCKERREFRFIEGSHYGNKDGNKNCKLDVLTDATMKMHVM